MKKVILLTVAVAMFIALPLGSVFAYEAFRGPTEVIQYDPGKAYNGYTLISQIDTLIDMEGNVVNIWPTPTSPPNFGWNWSARLLENGNMEQLLMTAYLGPSGESNFAWIERDWDGNIVNVLVAPENRTIPKYAAHHDARKIFDVKLNQWTVLVIYMKNVEPEEALALGADPQYNYDHAQTCGMIQYDMDNNIVWEWWFADHTVQNIDPTLPNYGVIADHPGKIDINFANPDSTLAEGESLAQGIRRDWQHTNSCHYNGELDHIVIDSKHHSEFYVIDHDATLIPGDPEASMALAAGPQGDFLYRWGNPCVYDSGECPGFWNDGDLQMSALHDIQWINPTAYTGGPALPGAGNFLLFDNGTWLSTVSRARIIEVDGYDEASGLYVPEAEAGYHWAEGAGMVMLSPKQHTSNQQAWSFEAQLNTDFSSSYISSCQRLPNGNTLVCSGEQGHLFEVTPGELGTTSWNLETVSQWQNQEVVWEYIVPLDGKRFHDQGDIRAVYRAHRYGTDYPGLAGKDLTSRGTLTGVPYGEYEPPPPVPITGWGIPPGTSTEAGGAAAGGGGEGGY